MCIAVRSFGTERANVASATSCGYVSVPRISLRTTSNAPGKLKAYACGEDIPQTMVQPDYGQFFPFAFFFTILHVVALTVTTLPAVKRVVPLDSTSTVPGSERPK